MFKKFEKINTFTDKDILNLKKILAKNWPKIKAKNLLSKHLIDTIKKYKKENVLNTFLVHKKSQDSSVGFFFENQFSFLLAGYLAYRFDLKKTNKLYSIELNNFVKIPGGTTHKPDLLITKKNKPTLIIELKEHVTDRNIKKNYLDKKNIYAPLKAKFMYIILSMSCHKAKYLTKNVPEAKLIACDLDKYFVNMIKTILPVEPIEHIFDEIGDMLE